MVTIIPKHIIMRYLINLKFIPLDENILYGDTNNDGEINMSDAVVLQSYLIGCNISIGYEADLNQDGKVNVFDMIMLKRMLMKKIIIL